MLAVQAGPGAPDFLPLAENQSNRELKFEYKRFLIAVYFRFSIVQVEGFDISKIDEIYMLEALKEAAVAFEKDEVPVGAVIVHQGRIIARAHNQIVMLKDPTAHAEMIAVTQAAAFLKSEKLLECCIYVTIEPCSMCAGALVLARVKRLVYGAFDSKTGACGSVFDIANSGKLNHRIKVTSGILSKECGSLLSDFFRKKRKKGSLA